MFSSDTSERGCNRNYSLSHIMAISKCKPQVLSDLLWFLTEKQTSILTYTNYWHWEIKRKTHKQWRGGGGEEKKIKTNKKPQTPPHHTTKPTCLNNKKPKFFIPAAVITSSPNRAGLLFYCTLYGVNKKEHAEAKMQKVYLGYYSVRQIL